MNIIKTSLAFALSLAAATASAQHGVTLTINSDDRATFTVLSTGPATVSVVELLAGSRGRHGAVFGPGTAGDMSWQHWGTDRYSVTTLSMDLRQGESDTFAINLDGVPIGDTLYSPFVYNPFAYANARALVVWSDGFEARIPMSRGLGGGVFSYSDVIATPVPEPGTTALMLAGCLLVGAVARKTGGAK